MKYGLIGEKLSHSFSKEIHESLAPYTYELCEIARDELAEFLQKREFCAVNVTMPYKAQVIPFLDELDSIASETGTVNTIVNRNGKLYGYNTDYYGMRDLILSIDIRLAKKKVIILGTGGTSRTAELVCRNLEAEEIIFVSREKKDGAITYEEMYSLHSDANVLINTTPVGMYPSCDGPHIDLDKFNRPLMLFDVVYNPLRTPLAVSAREHHIIASGGLYMLVSQAIYAMEHFLGRKLWHLKTEEIYRNILRQKENIVLIGMPASGKTTVGRLLADAMGRELIDLDDEIEKHLGMTIAKFFEDHTESEFRDIESELCREISKKSGIIIATGGGCVLRAENIRALRQNGRLYFIDRSPSSLLPTDSRPLARSAEAIEALYRERYDMYCSACDERINADTAPETVADNIREEFLRMKIMVINGPNLNMLGIREPEIYGRERYADLYSKIQNHCSGKCRVEIWQSNHEGELVNFIQRAYFECFDGIVINPAAYTHTSIALLDALKAVMLPTVEVHISDVSAREEYRQTSYIREACFATVSGEGTDGYLRAIDMLLKKIEEDTQ